jgi:hypothetical protein
MQGTTSPYHWDDIDPVSRDRMEAANQEVTKITERARETSTAGSASAPRLTRCRRPRCILPEPTGRKGRPIMPRSK